MSQGTYGQYGRPVLPPPPPSGALPHMRPTPNVQIPLNGQAHYPNGTRGMPQLSPGGGEFHGHPHGGGQPGHIPPPSASPVPAYTVPSPFTPPPVSEPYQHHYAPPAPSVAAVPAPTPKVAYEPPVFRTFQDRKRAKEMALRAQAGTGSEELVYSPQLLVSTYTPPAPSRSPSLPPTPVGQPLAPSRSPSLPQPTAQPPSSTPSRTPGPPLPPSRSPSLPRPPSSPGLNTTTPSPSTPLSPGSSRPLPSPAPFTPPPRSSPSPFEATLERSDTVSSVKSLDRLGFSPGKRPLPKPPIGVNSSKSLDRGIPTGSADLRRAIGRKQPSIVEEEDELVSGIGSMGISPRNSRPPSIVEPVITPTIVPPPTILTPEIVTPPAPVIVEPPSDPKAPAKFTPLPAINFPDADADEEDRSPAGGIAFSGLPVIAVSSEEPPTMAVPTINVPGSSSPASSPSRLEPGAAIVCAECGHPIIGRIVNAMKKRFHPQCFQCDECGELLEHVSSYEWEGKAYCHLDYHDKFANRCHHCKTPIVDDRFVTLEDPILGQRYYHELHFFCSECGDPFLDPSKSSAPGARGGDDEETNAFVIHKGHPYCERCHLRLHKPKCKGCTRPIPDIAVNAMGAKWHKECFVCQKCGNTFANNLFFPKDGKAFCTSCYEETM